MNSSKDGSRMASTATTPSSSAPPCNSVHQLEPAPPSPPFFSSLPSASRPLAQPESDQSQSQQEQQQQQQPSSGASDPISCTSLLPLAHSPIPQSAAASAAVMSSRREQSHAAASKEPIVALSSRAAANGNRTPPTFLDEQTSIRDYLQYSSDEDALPTPRGSPDLLGSAANAVGGEEPTEARCFAYSNATASSSSSSVSFSFSPTASLLNTSLASYSPDDTEERGETRSRPLSSEDTSPASGNSPVVLKAAHYLSFRQQHTLGARLDEGCSEDDGAADDLVGQRFNDGEEKSLPPMSFSSSRRQTGSLSKRLDKRALRSADGLDSVGGPAAEGGVGLSNSASSSRRSSMVPKNEGLAESHQSAPSHRGHRHHHRRHSGPPAAGPTLNGRGTRTPPKGAHSSRPSSRRQSRAAGVTQKGPSTLPFLSFVSLPARARLTKETVSTALSVSVYVLVTFCAGVALLGILAGSYALSVGDDLKDRLIEVKLSAEEMVDMAKQEAKRVKIRLEKGVKKVAGGTAWNGTGEHPQAGLDGRNDEGTDYRELLRHVLKQVTPPVVYTVSVGPGSALCTLRTRRRALTLL